MAYEPPYAGYGPPPPQGTYMPPPQYPYPNEDGGYPTKGGWYPGYNMQGGRHMGPPPQGYYGQPEFQPKPEVSSGGIGGGGGSSRMESNQTGMEFSDAGIRRSFIRKMYSILMLQLLVTLGFIVLFLYNDNVKNWTRRNPYLVFVALGLIIVLMLVMACCISLRRKSPQNFIWLGLFTLAEGFLLGVISSVYQVNEIMWAVGITAVVCFGVTIFSFQTKCDFTAFGGILFVGVIVLMLFGILSWFFPVLKVAYACGGAFLFSCYLVYDTQLMMGGKRKMKISAEEYILAALNIYLDIFNIFMCILAFFSRPTIHQRVREHALEQTREQARSQALGT